MSQFRGIPERFKEEGIFVHGRELVVTGDEVDAMRSLNGTEIVKGVRYRISDLLVEPNGNVRGFIKRLVLEGQEGDFNPKRFRKVS